MEKETITINFKVLICYITTGAAETQQEQRVCESHPKTCVIM